MKAVNRRASRLAKEVVPLCPSRLGSAARASTDDQRSAREARGDSSRRYGAIPATMDLPADSAVVPVRALGGAGKVSRPRAGSPVQATGRIRWFNGFPTCGVMASPKAEIS